MKLKAWICEKCKSECDLDSMSCDDCHAPFPACVAFVFDGDGDIEDKIRLVNEYIGPNLSISYKNSKLIA